MSWQARVDYDPVMNADTLTIWRRVGDSIEVVIRVGDGNAEIHRQDMNVVSDFEPLRLPAGACRAIAEAVKPGPSAETLDALGEMLDVERRRVDMVLERLTARSGVDTSDQGQVTP